MEPDVLSSCSQERTACSYPEPDDFSTYQPILILWDQF
jgi:hypothetical protein